MPETVVRKIVTIVAVPEQVGVAPGLAARAVSKSHPLAEAAVLLCSSGVATNSVLHSGSELPAGS